jgi:hypothetical protein
MRELWTRRKTVQLMASAGTGLAVTAAAAGGPATAAQATTTVDLGRLRKYLAARGALPLERLTDFEQASAADEILANGWAGRGEPPL